MDTRIGELTEMETEMAMEMETEMEVKTETVQATNSYRWSWELKLTSQRETFRRTWSSNSQVRVR